VEYVALSVKKGSQVRALVHTGCLGRNARRKVCPGLDKGVEREIKNGLGCP
jgi:hypothetical protein